MTRRHVVDVPNARGRVELVEPGLFAGIRIELDGQPVTREGLFSPRYPIPTNDGGTFALEVRADPFRGGFTVKGPGLDGRVGDPIPLALGILAFLPFALVAVGGAIGGLMGGLGWAVNQQIARSDLPLPIRVALMLGVTLAAGAAWLVLAVGLQLALHG